MSPRRARLRSTPTASTRRRSRASAPSSPSRRANSGKPEKIIEKMVEGRVRKFYEESTLLKQAFVIDTERTVETVLKDAAKDLGGGVTVTDFVAFRLGEGVQRERRRPPDQAGTPRRAGKFLGAPT